MKTWSRIALSVMLLAWTACAESVRLAKTTDAGGIVIYPFKERGALLSPFRKQALALMEQRCGGAYHIVREGETQGRSRVSEHAGGAEVIRERRWGIEFECRR